MFLENDIKEMLNYDHSQPTRWHLDQLLDQVESARMLPALADTHQRILHDDRQECNVSTPHACALLIERVVKKKHGYLFTCLF